MGKANVKWSDEDSTKLIQMCKDGADLETIVAAYPGRSVDAIKSQIARIPFLESEKAFDALSAEEKMAKFREMCEYYTTHDAESTLLIAHRKFGISQSYISQVLYKPSMAQMEEIAKFQAAYNHCREIYKIGNRLRRFSGEERKQLISMFESEVSLENIAKVLNCSTEYADRTIREYLKQKAQNKTVEDTDAAVEEQESPAEEPEEAAEEQEMVIAAQEPQPEPEYKEVSLDDYLDCAEPMVASYNNMAVEYTALKERLKQLSGDLAKVSEAIELLKK